MSQVVLHLLVLLALGGILCGQALADDQHIKPDATTNGDDKSNESVKDQVRKMKEDPNTADAQKLDEAQAKLAKEIEKKKANDADALSDDEIKELTDDIAKLREGLPKVGDGSKGSVTGDSAGLAKSGLPSPQTPPPSTAGLGIDSQSRSLSGQPANQAAASAWSNFVTNYNMRTPAGEIANQGVRGNQPTPAMMASATPPVVQQQSTPPASPPPSEVVASTGSVATNNTVTQLPASALAVSGLAGAAPQSSLSPSTQFFADTNPTQNVYLPTPSIPAINSFGNAGTANTVVPAATAAVGRETGGTSSLPTLAASDPVSGSSIPKPALDTRLGLSTVRTVQAPNQVPVTSEFQFTASTSSTPTSMPQLSTTAQPIEQSAPRNFNAVGTSAYQTGPVQTSLASDPVVNQITSQYAIAKGNDVSQDQRPVSRTIFARSQTTLDQMTALKAVNPPQIEDSKLTRGLSGTSPKGRTSLVALQVKPMPINVPTNDIRGALGSMLPR